VKEEWQQMLNRGVPAEQWCQSTDLVGKRCPDMLRSILREFSNAGNHSGKDHFLVEQLRKA
jgi:hypothetical protein